MTIPFDVAWAAGFLFAMCRMAAFTIASPVLSRALPRVGRIIFTLSMSLFFATPVTGSLGMGELVGGAVTNVVVGLVLAFVSGIIFYLFEIAGGIIDMSSGLAIGRIIDPASGMDAGVYGRLFNLTALSIFLVIGGDRLLVHALSLSVEAVPLTGSVDLAQSMGGSILESVGRLMFAGVELAAPALAALFLAEVALGVAARFSPQSNVFLLGLPAKLLVTLAVIGGVFALFPGTMQGVMDTMTRSITEVLRALQ